MVALKASLLYTYESAYLQVVHWLYIHECPGDVSLMVTVYITIFVTSIVYIIYSVTGYHYKLIYVTTTFS